MALTPQQLEEAKKYYQSSLQKTTGSSSLPQTNFKLAPARTVTPKQNFPTIDEQLKDEPEDKGFLKTLATGILQPFVKAGVTARQAGTGVVELAKLGLKSIDGLSQEEKEDFLRKTASIGKPVNAGWLGEIKPVGPTKFDETGRASGKFLSGGLDMLGTAAEMASWYGTGSLAKYGFKEALKQGTKGLAKLGLKVGGMEAGINAIGGAGVALQEEKPTISSVVGMSTLGAGLGMTIGFASPFAARYLTKEGRALGSALLKTNRVESATEKVVKGYTQGLHLLQSDFKKVEVKARKEMDDILTLYAEDSVVPEIVNGRLFTLKEAERLAQTKKQLDETLVKSLDNFARKNNLDDIATKVKTEISLSNEPAIIKQKMAEDVDTLLNAEKNGLGRNQITDKELHDIKNHMWGVGYDINRQTMSPTARKIGRVAKELIEKNNPNQDIKVLNELSGKYNVAINLLKDMHGRSAGGNVRSWLSRFMGGWIAQNVLQKVPVLGKVSFLMGEFIAKHYDEFLNDPERIIKESLKAAKKANIDNEAKKILEKFESEIQSKAPFTPAGLLPEKASTQKSVIELPGAGILEGQAKLRELGKNRVENLAGVFAGFEEKKDENGKVIGYKFNPEKAALGLGLVVGLKKLNNSAKISALEESFDRVKSNYLRLTQDLGKSELDRDVRKSIQAMQDISDELWKLRNDPGFGLTIQDISKKGNLTVGKTADIDTLLSEARKYKSAEEFVKAQDPVILTSEKTPRKTSDVPGVYLSTNERYAGAYADGQVLAAHHYQTDTPENGIIYKVLYPESAGAGFGDIMKSLDEESLVKLLEESGIDTNKALRLAKNPQEASNYIDPRVASDWMEYEMGYSELVLPEIKYSDILEAKVFEDGKLVNTIKGGAKESDLRDSLVVYSGTPYSETANKMTQLTDIWNEANKKIPQVYKGEADLTTKFLEYAKGKTTLSKQEILDFARRPELKKGEADLLNMLGKEIKDNKISAQEFADSVRQNLLELKTVKVKEPQYRNVAIDTRFQNESDMRKGLKNMGKNYEEVVFESPITTNGSSHFPNSKNYFAHARGDEVVEGGKKIWREQEIQSDLLQKDRFEKRLSADTFLSPEEAQEYNRYVGLESYGRLTQADRKRWAELQDIGQATQDKGKSQLSPFTNDRFGERIMRERIKEKASKGYSKYRLPTGETIGKIEGFENPSWLIESGTNRGKLLTKENLKVGDEVMSGEVYNNANQWIITDILGDGRFKAVPKNVEDARKAWKTVKDTYTPPSNQKYLATNSQTGEVVQFATPAEADSYIEQQIKRANEQYAETFNLTGKSNPQYKRYEQWGKWLKNKFGGKTVTDPQGNTWVEIDLKPEYKKMPIEAFGLAPIFLMDKRNT